MKTFRTVLGTNHKKPRSRIWLEGERLKAAGFTVGSNYRRYPQQNKLVLVLSFADAGSKGLFKVSGKGDKPIIDITGKVVTERFAGTHVEVVFDESAKSITITPAP
jgi:hypothetical protein